MSIIKKIQDVLDNRLKKKNKEKRSKYIVGSPAYFNLVSMAEVFEDYDIDTDLYPDIMRQFLILTCIRNGYNVKYATNIEFKTDQVKEIIDGLRDSLPVQYYAKPEFTSATMRKWRVLLRRYYNSHPDEHRDAFNLEVFKSWVLRVEENYHISKEYLNIWGDEKSNDYKIN